MELEEREGQTDGTVSIQRMQEQLVKRHGHPVEMVEVLNHDVFIFSDLFKIHPASFCHMFLFNTTCFGS